MLFFSILLAYGVYSLSVSDFQGKAFQITNKESGIYEVSVGLNETFQGIMVAYGDFNGDKAVDTVVINQERNAISILYWTNNNFAQENVCQSNSQNTSCFPGTLNADSTYQIYGITPLDFNYDGLLDLLLIYQSGDDIYNLMVLFQDSTTSSTSNYPKFDQQFPIKYKSTSYPFVADFFGDHRTTIMITDQGVRKIVGMNGTQNVNFQQLVNDAGKCISGQTLQTVLNARILNPHFNSFVDINLDCRADLIITSTAGIEYWYTDYISGDSTSQARFCLMQVVPFNGLTLNTLSFQDINFDGSIDMISIVTDTSSQQSILINYNSHQQTSDSSQMCQSSISYTDQNATYPYNPEFTLQNSSYTVSSILLSPNNDNLYVYNQQLNTNFNQLLAPFIRFGDYLASGYPGALTILSNAEYTNPTVQYLANVECAACENCGTQLVVSTPRCLQVQIPGNGFDQISGSPAINVAFFDYGENGRLDFLVNSYSTSQINITAFYNYISLDAFYLKALGIDGECAASDESYVPCLGALYYGSSYQFSVTNIDGKYKPAVGAQLFQSAYTPLQLPYAYVGLGRTNNYVENFFLGMPLVDGATYSWTPIIPNSQLIVSPYTDNTNQWTLSIFIEPTEAILVVVIVTVIILLLLGGIIVWKHIKEKEEDKQNQEIFNQMFR